MVLAKLVESNAGAGLNSLVLSPGKESAARVAGSFLTGPLDSSMIISEFTGENTFVNPPIFQTIEDYPFEEIPGSASYGERK